MTDPITCPECGGRKQQRLGTFYFRCRFCKGLGWVGGPNEPAETNHTPPKQAPPVWERSQWRDPMVASTFPCRYCLGAQVVTSVDEAARTMLTVPCQCAAKAGGAD
ncbi:hypothetical protein [Sinosporangium siamense]|uniref:hypothetical protein n=1 Tax=Sinosporangium siamense TaxID=1367973 RepID=UPI0019513D11|nr:hypothetical protein [Sinosporangium siamense]